MPQEIHESEFSELALPETARYQTSRIHVVWPNSCSKLSRKPIRPGRLFSKSRIDSTYGRRSASFSATVRTLLVRFGFLLRVLFLMDFRATRCVQDRFRCNCACRARCLKALSNYPMFDPFQHNSPVVRNTVAEQNTDDLNHEWTRIDTNRVSQKNRGSLKDFAARRHDRRWLSSAEKRTLHGELRLFVSIRVHSWFSCLAAPRTTLVVEPPKNLHGDSQQDCIHCRRNWSDVTTKWISDRNVRLFCFMWATAAAIVF